MVFLAWAGGWLAVAAGGLYSWATNIYSYNREAWMTDISLKQQYEYQHDNLQIATHGMSREEVRDRTQAIITRLSNYILVTTLILALAAEILVEGRIPVQCATFILNVYMLCMGTSVLYLVLSILFGVVASNEIYQSSARLLTQKPPPWKDIDDEMRRRANENLKSEAFEDASWWQILRPPLLRRLYARRKAKEINKKSEEDDGQPCTGSTERVSGTMRETTVLFAEKRRSTASMASISPESGTSPRKQSMAAAVSEAVGPTIRKNSSRRSNFSTGYCGAEPAFKKNMSLEGIRSIYDDGWNTHQQVWEPLVKLSFKCLALGVKNLLDVYGYLCMAFFYSTYKSAWAFWAVMFIFTSLNVIFMEFLFGEQRYLTMLVGFVPIAFAVSATTPYLVVDRILVPVGYIIHFWLHFVVSSHVELLEASESHSTVCSLNQKACILHRTEIGELSVPTYLGMYGCLKEEDETQELHVQDFAGPYRVLSCRSCRSTAGSDIIDSEHSEEDGYDADLEAQIGTDADEPQQQLPTPSGFTRLISPGGLSEMDDASTITGDMSRKMLGKREAAHKEVGPSMMLFARYTTLALWGMSVIWSIWKAARAEGYKNEQSLYREPITGPPLADITPLDTRWPSPYFRPHSLVCPSQDSVFMADQYRVFERKGDQVKLVDCDADGIIADVSADCDEKSCWPIVLLRQNPPKVLDCRTGKTWELLQAKEEAQQFAVVDNMTLLAAHQGEIVEYSWSQRKTGWSPSWVVADMGQRNLKALDVTNNKMLAFRKRDEMGIVEMQDLQSGLHCGTWLMPPAVVGAGCAHDNTVLLLVEMTEELHGATVRLVQAEMNGQKICKFQDTEEARDRFAFATDPSDDGRTEQRSQSAVRPSRDDDMPRYGDNWRTQAVKG